MSDIPNIANIIEVAKSQYKRVATAEVDGQVVVLRRPSRAEFDSFWETDRRPSDYRRLILDCRVHPSEEALRALLDEYPALAIGNLGAVCVQLSAPKKKSKAVLL